MSIQLWELQQKYISLTSIQMKSITPYNLVIL